MGGQWRKYWYSHADSLLDSTITINNLGVGHKHGRACSDHDILNQIQIDDSQTHKMNPNEGEVKDSKQNLCYKSIRVVTISFHQGKAYAWITWITSFTSMWIFFFLFFQIRHELQLLAALPLTDWALRLAVVSQSTLPTAHPPPCPSGEVEALEAEIATHASLQTHRLVCPSSLTPSSLSFKQRGTEC